MSGNFGWRGDARDRDDSAPSAFHDAHRAYTPGTSYTRPTPASDDGGSYRAPFTRAADPPPPPTPTYPAVDLTPRIHSVTALNYLGVAIDTTGSVGSWRPELFKRLALLFLGSVELLGGTVKRKGTSSLDGPPVTTIDGRKILELQFIGFGDADISSDTIEVAPPGSGPELDGYLHHMRKDCSGGGNDHESSDQALLFADRMVKLPEGIRQKLFVIVTDEPYPDVIDPEHAQRWLGITLQGPTPLSKVVDSLRARGWSLWCVQKPLSGDGYTQETRKKWQALLGDERVLPLDDARRVVDDILGIVAIQAGKFDVFTADLISRHDTPDNKYGKVNVRTVLTSLSSASVVLGAAGKPMRAPQTKALLPAHPDTKIRRDGHTVIDVDLDPED